MKKNIMILLCMPFMVYGMQKPASTAPTEYQALDIICWKSAFVLASQKALSPQKLYKYFMQWHQDTTYVPYKKIYTFSEHTQLFAAQVAEQPTIVSELLCKNVYILAVIHNDVTMVENLVHQFPELIKMPCLILYSARNYGVGYGTAIQFAKKSTSITPEMKKLITELNNCYNN